MNAERLLAHYERIADAPDAITRLRRFILDLAVRGKLVLQDPNDEPASELLRQIGEQKRERQRRTGDARIRMEPNPKAEDLPMVLPEGWAVQSFENLFLFIDYRGNTPPKTDEGIPLITAKNIRMGYLNREPREYIAEKTFKTWMTRGFPEIGDLFFTTEAPLANVCLNEMDEPFALAQRAICFQPYGNIDTKFLMFALMSDLIQSLIDAHATGMTAKGIKAAKLKPLPLPIPPLAEQHRIVAKVDELMVLCDRLETSRAAREATRDRLTAASLSRLNAPDPDTFHDDARFVLDAIQAFTTQSDQIKHLRQTVLNLAVRGKLVPQNSNEEPASALLEAIAGPGRPRQLNNGAFLGNFGDTPLPFLVPIGWEWTRVRDILEPQRDISYGVIKLGTEPKDGGIPTLRCSDVKPGFIDFSGIRRVAEEIENEYVRTRLHGGEVLINIRGTLGGVAKVPVNLRGYNIAREVAMVPIATRLSADFIVCTMLSPFFWNRIEENLRGIAYKGLNLGSLRDFPIPLPPLAEQHRIVAKVDALMALCNQLEASLGTAANTRRRLLDALLAEALAVEDAMPQKRHADLPQKTGSRRGEYVKAENASEGKCGTGASVVSCRTA
jgi:type I restriction enzyme, S subunit